MACCQTCDSGAKECPAHMQGPIQPGSMPMSAGFGPNPSTQNVPNFGLTGTWTAFDAEVVSEASLSDGKIPRQIMRF